jgi:hypothetical protein
LQHLETISKEQLYAQNLELRGQVIELQFQLDQLKRLVFGQTRERFVPSQGVQQPTLFSSPDVGVVVPAQVVQVVVKYPFEQVHLIAAIVPRDGAKAVQFCSRDEQVFV